MDLNDCQERVAYTDLQQQIANLQAHVKARKQRREFEHLRRGVQRLLNNAQVG
jgi:hypothetical protein